MFNGLTPPHTHTYTYKVESVMSEVGDPAWPPHAVGEGISDIGRNISFQKPICSA